MPKPRRDRHAGRRPARLLAGTALAAAALAVGLNGDAVRSGYLRRLPPERLARDAAARPGDFLLLDAAAARLLAGGRAMEARRLLEPQAGRFQDRPRFHLLLGRACQDAGSPREAYARLKVALLLRPDDPEAHWWLGETLRGQGRPEEARTHFLRVTELDPGREDAWLRLAREAVEAGRSGSALSLLERAGPGGAAGEKARLRARALAGLGRFEEALRAAREAVARDSVAESRLLLGRLLAGGPDPAAWREAAALLEGIAADPGGAAGAEGEVQRELGLVCRQLGEHGRAVRHLRAHLRRDPTAVRTYPPLAGSYAALGKTDLAAGVLAIYRKLEPVEIRTAQAEYQATARGGAPQARLALARTYAECGLEDRARAVLEGILAEQPDQSAARALLQQLPPGRSLRIPSLPADPEADH